jgi:tetratricopeptide (TPR) repeat protein
MIRFAAVLFIAVLLALTVGRAPASASPAGVQVSDAEPSEGDAAPDAAPAMPQPPALTRQQKLDDLFARLAASTDIGETNGLVGAIDRLQLDSGSDTGDFLMARAIAAMGTHNLEISLALLNKIIVLQPGWAEAWNKRATVRYLLEDEQGSMADIAHVLALEPRHFGALSGMAMILERRGFRDGALRAYRRALEIAPQLSSLRNAVDRLTTAVDGQSL